jgi:flagellar biosynthesis protein FliR
LAVYAPAVGDPGSSGLLSAVVDQLEAAGISLEAWALAWARLSPSLALIPAFGARLVPPAGKAVLGLALGFVVAPALVPGMDTSQHWALGLLLEAARGLPIALSAAALLWAASMAGGLAEDLRGGGPARVGLLEPDTPGLSALFGLFAAACFLKLGGAQHLAAQLSAPTLAWDTPLLGAIFTLVGALNIAVALAAPLLVSVVVWEVAAGLIARAATPAYIQMTLAPARALVVLIAAALSLQAVFELIVQLIVSG